MVTGLFDGGGKNGSWFGAGGKSGHLALLHGASGELHGSVNGHLSEGRVAQQ
jgi:hypothetical protein